MNRRRRDLFVPELRKAFALQENCGRKIQFQRPIDLHQSLPDCDYHAPGKKRVPWQSRR